MTGPPPGIRFLAPGAYPGQRGTPLAIRWLAEAWREYGRHCEIWTADAGGGRSLSPCPGRPDVTVRRFSRFQLSTRSGPSVRRGFAAIELAAALRRHSTPDCVVHAHGPDAAWLCRLAGLRRWVAHQHTSVPVEMPSYWPFIPRIARIAGHVLDYASSKAPQTLSFHRTRGSHPLEPVVPVYEAEHVSTYRAPPASTPLVVYLGNADRYQDLELLFRARWSPHLRRRWVVNHELDPRIRRRAEDAGFEVRVPSSLADALHATAEAWWGLCPRRQDVGYPYKILTYAMLGLPVLSSRRWPGVQTQIVSDWSHLELRSPPERTSCQSLMGASNRTLVALDRIYRIVSQSP